MSLYSEDDDAEFISHRPVKFDKHVEILLKSFSGRIQAAHTLTALQTVRRDIERSPLTNNFPARDVLRSLANKQAKDIGWKQAHEGERWWS